MKRIIMLVAVALVMAAMVLAMAMPVFAQQGPPQTVPDQVCAGPADNRSPVIRETPTAPAPECNLRPDIVTPF